MSMEYKEQLSKLEEIVHNVKDNISSVSVYGINTIQGKDFHIKALRACTAGYNIINDLSYFETKQLIDYDLIARKQSLKSKLDAERRKL
jgi:hypothetical protein